MIMTGQSTSQDRQVDECWDAIPYPHIIPGFYVVFWMKGVASSSKACVTEKEHCPEHGFILVPSNYFLGLLFTKESGAKPVWPRVSSFLSLLLPSPLPHTHFWSCLHIALRLVGPKTFINLLHGRQTFFLGPGHTKMSKS